MKQLVALILLFSSLYSQGQVSPSDSLVKQVFVQESQVELSIPIIDVSSVFFTDSTLITSRNTNQQIQTIFSASHEGYPMYRPMQNNRLMLSESGRFIFKNTSSNGLLESTTEAISVLKLPTEIIKEISLSEEANASYPGKGAITLVDLQKGTNDFRDGKWLGFSTQTLTIDLQLKKKKKISKVIISTYRNQGAWIFVPEQVEILIKGKVVANLLTESDIEKVNELVFLTKEFDTTCVNELQIRITSLEKLPEWHPGKGALPWFFLDEIIVE